MSKCICGNCRKTFDEDEAETYSECVGDFWGSPAYMSFFRCPYCGCNDIYDYNEEDDYNNEWGDEEE